MTFRCGNEESNPERRRLLKAGLAAVAWTAALPWLTDFANGGHFTDSSSTLPAVAGYPHITVPMVFAFGLPVGVSFFGRAWSEPLLIKLAYSFEQATRHRRPPQFRPGADA
jgi:amidase